METDPFISEDELYVFTYGEIKNDNEKGYGFFVATDGYQAYNSGKFSFIENESQWLGDLKVIHKALLEIKDTVEHFKFKKIILINNGNPFSIEILTNWYYLEDKYYVKVDSNVILPILDILQELHQKYSINYVYSNVDKEPSKKTLHDWFLWFGNTKVKNLAESALKK